jgi:hypothetical protein
VNRADARRTPLLHCGRASRASPGHLVISPASFRGGTVMIESGQMLARIADLKDRVGSLRGYL